MTFPARGSFVKLGKGSLLLDLLDDNGQPEGLEFLGNANSISISAEVTDVELFSSTEKSGALIDRAVLRTAYSLSVSLNEFTLNNLKLFLKGEDNVVQQAAQSQESVTITGAKVGKYYETGFRRITSVVVNQGSLGPFVEGTDYEVNSEFGIIRILPGGTITDDDDLTVAFEAPAVQINQVRIARKASSVGRLLYLADDANNSGAAAKDRLEVWKVDVAPDGELNFVGDDYGAFSLSLAVLSDAENHPNDPYGTLDRIGTQ